MKKINPIKLIRKKILSVRLFYQACKVYQQGINDAELAYKRDHYRYYVIWDRVQDKLIPITYDLYKGRGDSYKYLVRRGRFLNRLTRDELKHTCFYFTPSRNSTCRLHGNALAARKEEFFRYYFRLKMSQLNCAKINQTNLRFTWKRLRHRLISLLKLITE